ncbi:MAG: hypothetical protein M3458_04695 [Acidobacteriota bacterium]|nr:hypothetical protein [Acidobacteriota bacterium]
MLHALSVFGVPKHLLCEEYFFNFKHRSEEEMVARLRRRFVAIGQFSPAAAMDAMLHRF